MNCERFPVLPDQRVFELLVDGELDEVRRRELLSRLDNMPDGWKSCALAFLEAQALRAVLRAPAVGSAAPLQPALRARKSPIAMRAARLAVAAGLLLAAF